MIFFSAVPKSFYPRSSDGPHDAAACVYGRGAHDPRLDERDCERDSGLCGAC